MGSLGPGAGTGTQVPCPCVCVDPENGAGEVRGVIGPVAFGHSTCPISVWPISPLSLGSFSLPRVGKSNYPAPRWVRSMSLSLSVLNLSVCHFVCHFVCDTICLV